LTAEAHLPWVVTDAARPPTRLFVAALVGRIANEMTAVAVVLLVLARGQGLAIAGITAGALALPGVITGPVLGALLDRAPRPLRVISVEQAIGAVGLALLAVSVGHVPAALTVLLAGATGALQPLSTGGMTSVLTGADEEFLPRATSVEAASFGTASVIGPLLAAVLAGLEGAALAVLVQAGLKLVAMAITVTAPEVGTPRRRRGPRPPIRATVAAGFQHFSNAGPLAAITVSGAMVMAGRGLFTVAFPFFATGSLGKGQDFAGFLWGAFAAGSAIGAIALTPLSRRWPSQWVAVSGAALAGLALFPVPALESVAPSLLLLALAGALYGPSLAATFDVRRRFTPRPFLGQVFTTAASVKNASFAIGAAFSGALVSGIGADDAILVAAGLHVAASVVGAVLLESRRR
jgi:predicted MFS family arabinose efflux permease